MKKALGFDNLRECYFQAVSNSTWANEGYLVAYEISGNDDFLKELCRLNNAFGIGIIKLNPKIITQSEILFPSKFHELDWDTVEKLSCINNEFKNFLLEITSDKKSNNIKNFYDEPLQVSDHTGREVDDICADYALKKHIINGDGEQRMWMVINPHPLQSYHKFLFIEPSFYLDKTAMFQQFIKVRNNTELYEY